MSAMPGYGFAFACWARTRRWPMSMYWTYDPDWNIRTVRLEWTVLNGYPRELWT